MDLTLCLLFTWGQMGEEYLSIYIRLHLVYREKHKAVISKLDCFSYKVARFLAKFCIHDFIIHRDINTGLF